MYRDGQAGRMSDPHRNRLVLLVVLGLIAASAIVITTQRTILGLDLRGGVQLVYQAEPNGQNQVTTASRSRRSRPTGSSRSPSVSPISRTSPGLSTRSAPRQCSTSMTGKPTR